MRTHATLTTWLGRMSRGQGEHPCQSSSGTIAPLAGPVPIDLLLVCLQVLLSDVACRSRSVERYIPGPPLVAASATGIKSPSLQKTWRQRRETQI